MRFPIPCASVSHACPGWAGMRLGLLVFAGCLIGVSVSAVEIVENQAFEAGTLPGGRWGFWTGTGGGTVSISTDATKNHNGSAGSLKGTYPARSSAGGGYVWCGYDVSALATRDLYFDFWAKMPTATKQGVKFLKIFGQLDADDGNYANTTFGLDYTGVDVGSMYTVSFGDGSGLANDTASVIPFDGSVGSWIGRSFGTAVVSTPQRHKWHSANWGTTWHHFRMRVKFNSGTSAANEVADGAYYVEIDGLVYVDATRVFNRHWSNGPIDRVELFGWTQTGTTPFELWYDDVKITTNGFDEGTPSNRAPVAQAQSASTSEDTAKVLTLGATDADGDALSYAIVTGPGHGSLTGSGASRTYTPAADYHGSDSFTFRANDGTMDSPAATVSLTITSVNDAPVAQAQTVSVAQDTATPVVLEGSDRDGGTLSYAIATGPVHGTVSGSGAARTYTPTAGYAGSDSFTFTAGDGTLSSAPATVSISVTPGGVADTEGAAESGGDGDGKCGAGGIFGLILGLGLLSLGRWRKG